MKQNLSLLLVLILTACAANPTPVSFFDSVTPPAADTNLAPMPASTAAQLSLPVITESSQDEAAEQAGELYFFLQPRQGGGNIELARVSGVCAFDDVNCPPVEKIQVPFALSFTLNALSWSPDGKYAAFAYPDNANGTPQKLFIFDPAAKTWTAIAEFPYIDPPFWSPNGSQIVFRAQDGLGGEKVFTIRRDGLDLKGVSNGLSAAGRPYIVDGWYGEDVLVHSALSGGIYQLHADNGTAHPLFASSPLNAPLIAAPDAGLFVYDDYDRNTQKHILKSIQPDGANPLALAEFTGGNLYPIVWSPDGKFIAFNYSSAGAAPVAEVYVINRAGDRISAVYRGATVGRLIFSPNGKYLLVEETTSISGGHLFTVNLATLEQKILQAPGLSTDYDWYAPSWKP